MPNVAKRQSCTRLPHATGSRHFQNLEEKSSGFFVFAAIRGTIVDLVNLVCLVDLANLVSMDGGERKTNAQ